MAEEKMTQGNSVQSGDDITCPNCGGHNVYCVPYPKVEFASGFFCGCSLRLAVICSQCLSR